MKTTCDDCWPPSPGSWEEHVEPYQAQRARLQLLEPADEQQQLPFDAMAEYPSNSTYSIPISA